MNRAVLKLGPNRGGWIHNTIAPIQDKHEARFGVLDVLLLATLITTVVTLARILLAH